MAINYGDFICPMVIQNPKTKKININTIKHMGQLFYAHCEQMIEDGRCELYDGMRTALCKDVYDFQYQGRQK